MEEIAWIVAEYCVGTKLFLLIVVGVSDANVVVLEQVDEELEEAFTDLLNLSLIQ